MAVPLGVNLEPLEDEAMKKYSLADTLGRINNVVSHGAERVIGFSVRETWSFIEPITSEEGCRIKRDLGMGIPLAPDRTVIFLAPNRQIKHFPTNLSGMLDMADVIKTFLPIEDDVPLAGYVYALYTPFFTPETIRQTEIRIYAPLEGACDSYRRWVEIRLKDGSKIVLEGEVGKGNCGWETITERKVKLLEPIDIDIIKDIVEWEEDDE